MPLVSVVIPTYNTARYIGETLDSVFAQDYPHYEVIVVNDGSPDTPELERVLERFDGRITYIKKANGGVASARNAGIRASKGDFIATVDSDDLLQPNWMPIQVDYFRNHPNVDLVYGDGVIFGEGLAEVLVSALNPSEGSATFESIVSERCCVPTPGVLMRREALFDIGLLDETLRWGEDFDLWLRIAKGGHRIEYHREVIFRYRRHTGGVSSQPTTLHRYGVTVIEKLLREGGLTPEERSAAQQAKQRLEARIHMAEGKIAFEARDFAVAAEKLAAANTTLRQSRLSIIVALLRFCPSILWHARRWMAGTSATARP
jgi:alpha-1,6-rhamnosyltransferase